MRGGRGPSARLGVHVRPSLSAEQKCVAMAQCAKSSMCAALLPFSENDPVVLERPGLPCKPKRFANDHPFLRPDSPSQEEGTYRQKVMFSFPKLAFGAPSQVCGAGISSLSRNLLTLCG